MPKFSALIATVFACLALPALASAAPTTTHISAPSNPAFVTIDRNNAGSLHVAGTTSGGTGDVDLRCYSGNDGPLLASQVPVVNGAFATDIAFTPQLFNSKPQPFCTLRAIPTGTVPAAPPGAPSAWVGTRIGWGSRELFTVGGGFAPTPADTGFDYFIGRAQSAAFNDYYSVASCGLCDTYLFVPDTKASSNPIWWGNDGLYLHPTGVTGRSGVQIDGVPAYSGSTVYFNNGPTRPFANNPGFPAVSKTDTVDPVTGDLTIDERSAFATCAPDPAVFPPADASCPSFADSGVVLDRHIHQGDNGLQVTIVDHWKSVDGKAHDLDLIYEDTERSENASIAGREARAKLTWIPTGFTTFPANSKPTLPPSVPATMFVKTDGSTLDSGDHMNPIGAMTFGSKPSELELLNLGGASDKSGRWQTRYQRTIPAGGEVSIAVVYSHDFDLASVQAKVQKAEVAAAAPHVGIDSPADGSTVDAGSVQVTGTASSADGHASVKVNGGAAPVGPDGHWSADVPLSEGANQILAVASNAIGVTSTAIRSVIRPTAPAAVEATNSAAAAATPVAAAAKPVRCVVPKLRGKKLAAAKRLLRHAHCRLGKVVRKASKRVKPGRVVATRFKAGTRHRAGTRVRVTIAKKA